MGIIPKSKAICALCAQVAFLMFNLFSPPCFAAIGAMNSEINNKKWFFAGLGLQFSVGYVLSFLVYQIGTVVTESKVGKGFIAGMIAVIVIIAMVVFVSVRSNSKAKKECAAKKLARQRR